MKRLALVLTLTAVGATSLFVSATPAAVTTAKSTVTIAAGNGSEFRGKVNSARKQCRDDRKVTLYMKPYDGSADVAVGSDRTSASGAWSIEGSFVAGVYYARVASATVRANGVPVRCAFDLSVAMRY